MKNITKEQEQSLINSASKTIVAFHIGRGGSFHNPGFISFWGEEKISKFTDDLFLSYENESNFSDRFGFDTTCDPDQKCILDLIADKDFDELEEKFGITEEMLGEEIYSDGGNNPVGLTETEAQSGIGTINIDHDYDTTYTKYLSDCSEEELEKILNTDNYVSDDIMDYVKWSLNIEEESEEENG